MDHDDETLLLWLALAGIGLPVLYVIIKLVVNWMSK